RTRLKVQALDNITLDVATGEFVAIVGPSGCGKTTLLKVLAGLIKPSSGSVCFNGSIVSGPDRQRAMVFQSPALLPWRTVLGIFFYGLELQSGSCREPRSRAGDFIDLVGLKGFEESYPRELSEGMQRRATLARALAVEPELFLLDEPLAALD